MSVTERQGDNRPANPLGVYRHPKAGKEIITRDHPRLGTVQADAFVQMGYEYVGPAPKNKQAPKKEDKEK